MLKMFSKSAPDKHARKKEKNVNQDKHRWRNFAAWVLPFILVPVGAAGFAESVRAVWLSVLAWCVFFAYAVLMFERYIRHDTDRKLRCVCVMLCGACVGLGYVWQARLSPNPKARASIAVQSARITVFEVNKNAEAIVTFVNSSDITAKEVRVYGHFQLREKPVPPEMPGATDIKGEEPSQDVMPARTGIVHMPIRSGAPLTQEVFDWIDSGQRRIYIWGIVTYEDVLGKHWTKFCLLQYRKSMNFEICTNNNEMDRE